MALPVQEGGGIVEELAQRGRLGPERGPNHPTPAALAAASPRPTAGTGLLLPATGRAPWNSHFLQRRIAIAGHPAGSLNHRHLRGSEYRPSGMFRGLAPAPRVAARLARLTTGYWPSRYPLRKKPSGWYCGNSPTQPATVPQPLFSAAAAAHLEITAG